MSDANSLENVEIPDTSAQEASEKSGVQKRIDELTAEKYAYAKQLQEMTATVTELMKQKTAPVIAEPQQSAIPEGLDPGVAKWLMDQQKAQEKSTQAMVAETQKMYWQMQHQLDQNNVNQKHAGMPQEVRDDAARRLTGLKQRYPDANLDDAVKLAFADYAMKQMAAGKAVDFNNMNRALSAQGGSLPLGGGTQSSGNSLVPPTQLSNWDSLDLASQNKLISEYEKKGGSLF